MRKLAITIAALALVASPAAQRRSSITRLQKAQQPVPRQAIGICHQIRNPCHPLRPTLALKEVAPDPARALALVQAAGLGGK